MSSPCDEMLPLDPQLEAVYRRGYTLRRRRTVVRVAGVAAVLQLLVAVPLALASPSPPRQLRTVAGDVATTTSEASEPTTTSTVPPTPLLAAPRRTTTTLVCRNSTNPACGPFRWDPDPGPNAPLTVTVSFSPPEPRAGEPVTFVVTVDDPDAAYFWGGCSGFGDARPTCLDGSAFDAGDPTNAYCEANRYGPWTPPPRRHGHAGGPQEPSTAHVYDKPGTYTATFSVRSDSTKCGAHEPYGSEGEASVTVVVSPASTTTSTSSTTSTTALL